MGGENRQRVASRQGGERGRVASGATLIGPAQPLPGCLWVALWQGTMSRPASPSTRAAAEAGSVAEARYGAGGSASLLRAAWLDGDASGGQFIIRCHLLCRWRQSARRLAFSLVLLSGLLGLPIIMIPCPAHPPARLPPAQLVRAVVAFSGPKQDVKLLVRADERGAPRPAACPSFAPLRALY